MIVLDTNVVSETTRRNPNPSVVQWLESTKEELFLTSITVGELLFGLSRLRDGRRRTTLTEGVTSLLARVNDRILPYDVAAAHHFGALAANRESIGRPIGVADAQIAAICLAHKAICATRNVKDFGETGVELVNPWG